MKPVAVVSWLSRSVGYRGLAIGTLGFGLGIVAAANQMPASIDGELLASGLTAFASLVLAAIAVSQIRDAAAREARDAEQRHLQRRSIRYSTSQFLLDVKQPLAAKVAWCGQGDPRSATSWPEDVDFEDDRFALLFSQIAFLSVTEQNAVADVRSAVRGIRSHQPRTGTTLGEVLAVYSSALAALDRALATLEAGDKDDKV